MNSRLEREIVVEGNRRLDFKRETKPIAISRVLRAFSDRPTDRPTDGQSGLYSRVHATKNAKKPQHLSLCVPVCPLRRVRYPWNGATQAALVSNRSPRKNESGPTLPNAQMTSKHSPGFAPLIFLLCLYVSWQRHWLFATPLEAVSVCWLGNWLVGWLVG